MKKLLVTGGTVFVSRYTAEYFVKKGYDVYVLNRGSRPQSEGVTLIEADRHNLGSALKDKHFDCILDMTAYNKADIDDLLNGLDSFGEYILLSSSAVYPEYGDQPFREDGLLAANKFWGTYGTDKIEAERELINRVPKAYILRPPYLYGAMNNVYREAFVFECALQNREFYLPKDGSMKLQFFHILDLCRFMEIIIERKPANHIFNVGNRETVSVKDWVRLCYEAAGKTPTFVPVYEDVEQRNYFSFYDYEYCLDVAKQYALMNDTLSLESGLEEAFRWYVSNRDKVVVKPYMQYIDQNIIHTGTLLKYRKAIPSDMEEICNLVHNAVEVMEQHHIFQWDELYPTKEDFQEDIDKGQLYVGLADGQIAVVYTLNQECDKEYENGKWKYKEESFYVVHRLCVNPIFQNKGIARTTLLYIEKQLIEKGIHVIRLDAFSDNPFAIRLYDSLGYSKVGYADWRKGRFLLMEKCF